MIIDLRVRPPYRGFLDLHLFRNPEKIASWSGKLGMIPPPSSKECSMPMLLQEMEAAGVTYSVTPGRQANALMGRGVPNDDISALLKEYPNKFIGAAGIDPTDSAKAIEEIERTVVNGPLTAIHMEPGKLETPLYSDDKCIYPVYEYCAKHGIPILITSSGCNGPDLSYSNPVIFDKIAGAFPTATFIIVHGGYPWVTETLFVAFKRPNIYICPSMFMFNLPGVQEYVMAANTFLKDRFLFASAYPFVPFKEGVEAFCNLPFNPALLSNFLWKNAAKALKLDILLK